MTTQRDVDAATVEVIRNYLTSAAAEMQRTLVRTAYSTIIYEILDFGISVYDRDLNLIADSPGLSLFLGANDYSIQKAVEYVGEENMNPGDVLIMNYPYWSSAHTLDVCLFSPVFHDDELIGYTVCRAHWLDLGAKDQGYVLDSTDRYQEGLVFPGTKLFKEGEPDPELMDIIRFNSRMPDNVIGDINAQVAALNTGKKRLRELHGKYGSETVDACISEILDHGERSARSAIEDLPDGTWNAVDFADSDGVTDDPIRMEVTVTIDGDEFEVDFTGSNDQVTGPMNVPIGMTETICKLCLKTLTTPDENSNGGHYESLRVTAPEGCVFHATDPAPTFVLWTAILAIDVIFKALAKGMPDRIPASSGGDLCAMMVFGVHPETGRQFLESSNEGVGWGASEGQDGGNALMHLSESIVQNSPIEVFEKKAPVRFNKLELRQDSGGIGEFRGGLGIQRDYQFTSSLQSLSVLKKTKTEGWGLEGGSPGKKNALVLHPGTDREERTGTMRGEFEPGDVVSNRSGGGGGYGDPMERDPEAVHRDVVRGYVSRESARNDYGVEITDGNDIDWERTDELRSN
jgi:N-methylhydantoinase B